MAPPRLDARLWLGQLYVMKGWPDQALKVVEAIHAQAKSLGAGTTNQNDFLIVEVSARLARKELLEAGAAVEGAIAQHPSDETLLSTTAHTSLKYEYFSNA